MIYALKQGRCYQTEVNLAPSVLNYHLIRLIKRNIQEEGRKYVVTSVVIGRMLSDDGRLFYVSYFVKGVFVGDFF